MGDVELARGRLRDRTAFRFSQRRRILPPTAIALPRPRPRPIASRESAATIIAPLVAAAKVVAHNSRRALSAHASAAAAAATHAIAKDPPQPFHRPRAYNEMLVLVVIFPVHISKIDTNLVTVKQRAKQSSQCRLHFTFSILTRQTRQRPSSQRSLHTSPQVAWLP